MTEPTLSPLASLHAIELLLSGAAPASHIGQAAGLNRVHTSRLIAMMARSGLVLQAANRVGTCRLNVLPGLAHPADRPTVQRILAQVRRARTVTGIAAATQCPPDVVTDTLRRAVIRRQVSCVCVGHLPVFDLT